MHEIDLDAFDLRLLSALQENGRLTNQELAEEVGLSASQCSRRRTALEAAGAIAAYRAVLDPDVVGIGLIAFVEVTLARHSRDIASGFFEMLDAHDAVQEAYALTGEADYLIKVAMPDLVALSKFLSETMLGHASVGRVRSSIVLERVKQTTRLPLAHLKT